MTMRQMHVYSINANLSDQNNIIIGLFFLYESNFKLRHSMTSILPDSSVSTVITQGMEDKKILIFVTEGGGGLRTFIVPKMALGSLRFLFWHVPQE